MEYSEKLKTLQHYIRRKKETKKWIARRQSSQIPKAFPHQDEAAAQSYIDSSTSGRIFICKSFLSNSTRICFNHLFCWSYSVSFGVPRKTKIKWFKVLLPMHEVAAKPTTKNNKFLRSIVWSIQIENSNLGQRSWS